MTHSSAQVDKTFYFCPMDTVIYRNTQDSDRRQETVRNQKIEVSYSNPVSVTM